MRPSLLRPAAGPAPRPLRRAARALGLAGALLGGFGAGFGALCPEGAQAVPGTLPAPGPGDLPTAAGADRFQVLIVPAPLWRLIVQAKSPELRLGSSLHQFSLGAGYYWVRRRLLDDGSFAPFADGLDQEANYWATTAGWALRFGRGSSFGLQGQLLGGGLQRAPYDQPLLQGVSAQVGPVLRLSSVDEPSYPTRGATAELQWAVGQHWGDQDLTFSRAGLTLNGYVPLAPAKTLAMRFIAQAGGPQLAWLDKLSLGGSPFLRGYPWNRFNGDRLFAASLEYRDFAWPTWGEQLPCWAALPLGLAWETHVDVGRAWESQRAPAAQFDARAGGGAGLIMFYQGVPLARAELNASPEGVFPQGGLGVSF